jgi:hypothetical protein
MYQIETIEQWAALPGFGFIVSNGSGQMAVVHWRPIISICMCPDHKIFEIDVQTPNGQSKK